MGGVPQEMKRQNLDDDPQDGRGRQGRQEGQSQAGIKQPDHLESDVGADHVDFAVGEGYHAQGAKNHGKSQRQQGVYTSLGNTVDKLFKKDLVIHNHC